MVQLSINLFLPNPLNPNLGMSSKVLILRVIALINKK